MKIHEYQAKELLRAHGVPVPRGYPAFTVREAQEAAHALVVALERLQPPRVAVRVRDDVRRQSGKRGHRGRQVACPRKSHADDETAADGPRHATSHADSEAGAITVLTPTYRSPPG